MRRSHEFGQQPPEVQPVADHPSSDHLRRLARATLTPGIVDGFTIHSTEGGCVSGLTSYLTGDQTGQLAVGPTSLLVTLEPGTAAGDDGQLIEIGQETEVDLSSVLSASGDATGHLYACCSQPLGSEPEPPASSVCLRLPGHAAPRRGVPIASVKGDRSNGTLLVSPISAWLAASSVLVGSRTGGGLVITDDTIVANRSLHLLGGVGSRGQHGNQPGQQPGNQPGQEQGHVIVGPRHGENLVLSGTDLRAGVDGVAAELHLQRDGGELHIGGPVRGPEQGPLNIVGGSDLSLEGGGVLMLGDEDGANLIIDENEIMAREGGDQAALLLQWEGGETRFGGPLRGPAGRPLNIACSQDLSLGGHGALMIGPEEAANLVIDENEIMANTGTKAANLYMQWHGGETHFGGTVCGPDNEPLTIGSNTRLEGSLELFSNDGEMSAWLDEKRAGSLVTRSDRPDWQRVDPLENASELVRKLKPSRFSVETGVNIDTDLEVGSDVERPTFGFDARDVLEVAPELVDQRNDALGLCLADFAVIAIAALKEQQHTIDCLKQAVERLQQAT